MRWKKLDKDQKSDLKMWVLFLSVLWLACWGIPRMGDHELLVVGVLLLTYQVALLPIIRQWKINLRCHERKWK